MKNLEKKQKIFETSSINNSQIPSINPSLDNQFNIRNSPKLPYGSNQNTFNSNLNEK